MRANRILLGLVVALSLSTTARPETPLRLVPDQAELIAQIHEPRKLVEILTTIDAIKQVQQLDAVKELLDSTTYRRFYQLIAYFEKEMGLDHKDILDKVAGKGAVLASKYGDKPPILFAMQGTDAAVVEKFVKVGISIINQELARQELKTSVATTKYQGVEVFSLGNDLHAARIDSALLMSNNGDKLRAGIDCALGKEKKTLALHSGLVQASSLLPKNPLATVWFDIEPARKNPAFKAFYDTPRDPFITIVLGGWASLLGTTPYMAGGFYADNKEIMLTFRLPRGSENMGADGKVYHPTDGGPKSRPLLQPKGTLFSSSYHYDISRFWTDRVALFGPERAKDIENFDKQSSPLSSVGFSKLITCLSGYQRMVAVHQPKAAYTRQPRNPSPAFSTVIELRKPEEFTKGVETLLGTAGLFLTPQFGLKMKEEKIGDIELVGYRFDEKKNVPSDPDDIRYNFSPCYARVGNQFMVASTMELGRELVAILQAEAKSKNPGDSRSSRIVVSAAGGKEVLKSVEDNLVTTTILAQALPLAEAKAQVKAFLDLFDRLEGFSKEETYGKSEFHLDLRLKFKK